MIDGNNDNKSQPLRVNIELHNVGANSPCRRAYYQFWFKTHEVIVLLTY